MLDDQRSNLRQCMTSETFRRGAFGPSRTHVLGNDSVQNARNTQRELRNLRLERRAILGDQLIRSAHRSDGCLKLAAARILELLARSQ